MARAMSSTEWWSSTSRSPLQRRKRSMRLCFARAVSMWSRKPMPLETSAVPLPSRLTRVWDVGEGESRVCEVRKRRCGRAAEGAPSVGQERDRAAGVGAPCA